MFRGKLQYGLAYDQGGEAIRLMLLICIKLSEKMDGKEFGKGRRGRKKTGGNKSLRQGKRRFSYNNMTGVGSLLEVCSTLII